MKIFVQWTRDMPQDLEEMDSSTWGQHPYSPLPEGDETINNTEGWVYSLNVQGVVFEGFDHYAVENIPGDGVRVTVWNDDPEDFTSEEMYAQVWEFLPPAPDERIGGAMNTRQSLTVYAGDPSRFPQSDIMAEPCKPWSEFTPPPASATRYGITVPNEKALAHRQMRSPRSWREWIE